MSGNNTYDNYINSIKIDIKIKEQLITKKTKIIYYLFEKWTEDYETYLYTAIPICNEIDKLEKENSILYNNYQEYFEDKEKDYGREEEYEKQWDEFERTESMRD